MGAKAVAQVESMMASRIGLRLDPGLRARLARSLEEEAAAAGASVDDFAKMLLVDSDVFQKLLNRITVQQTSWFRDPEVFEALASRVIPALVEPVFVWSAGCSRGQEPYSLAMLLAESGLQEWTILGTDISTKALDRAQQGVYSKAELDGMSQDRIDRHMRPGHSGWEVCAELRSHVRFQHHNLNRPSLPVGASSCQLLLCRNVLIYFSAAELAALLERFAFALRPDGYLVVGASESLWQLTDRFRMHRVDESFIYRLPSVMVIPERRRNELSAPVDRRRPLSMRQLLGQGESAAAAGDFDAAAAAFRRASLSQPDHPLPYFELALCLEQSGQHAQARTALEAAQAAILGGDKAQFQADLDGFHVDELATAIERRLGLRC